MKRSQEELRVLIEEARDKMNSSIDAREDYEKIYQYSVALDRLIELYMVDVC